MFFEEGTSAAYVLGKSVKAYDNDFLENHSTELR